MSPVRKCLFPTAGYGTRFLPATKAMPKEMLPLLNKPLIQYGVEEALQAGITEMAIVTGRGKRALEDHFDVSYELEHQIAGTGAEKALAGIRALMNQCSFSYTRQLEMKGLGHAILTGETLIGNEAFAVLLADDYCVKDSRGIGVPSHMVKLYEHYKCSIVAIEEVPRADTRKYGIIDGELEKPGIYRVRSMVEKPEPGEATSTLAIIGRYILTPDIFALIRNTPKDRNGEIQITDALRMQAEQGRVISSCLWSKRFDCGSVDGFVAATNFNYQHLYTSNN
jgi:UTP--glucose-1-phosphate uridylyltransferase